MPPPTSRIGTTVAGRYRLESLLGQGGMGEVYVAVQQPLGRRVALKLIRASLLEHGATVANRFEREARSLAALAHPNIVTLFDFGRTGDGPADADAEMYMAMELLPGESLRQRLERVGRLSPKETLSVVADVCRALEAAHRAGIVHRDLKPDNVMLVDLTPAGGPHDFVKVLDFGIARLNDADEPTQPDLPAPQQKHITKTGHIVGTPGYIAPEMFTEGVLDDPRSDLYAAGVLTFELLTASALFTAPTPVMLLMKHAQTEAPTLASTCEANTPLPHPLLEAFLKKLLEKDRRQRFSSAAAVVDAIAALPDAAFAPFGTPRRQRAPASPASSSLDPEAPTIGDSRADLHSAAGSGPVDVNAATVVSLRPPAPVSSPALPSTEIDVGRRRPLPRVLSIVALIAIVAAATVAALMAFSLARPPPTTTTTLPTTTLPPDPPTTSPTTTTTPSTVVAATPTTTEPPEPTPDPAKKPTTKKPTTKNPTTTTTKPPPPPPHVPDMSN